MQGSWGAGGGLGDERGGVEFKKKLLPPMYVCPRRLAPWWGGSGQEPTPSTAPSSDTEVNEPRYIVGGTTRGQ